MATNFIQPGNTLTVTAAAIAASGEVVVIGNIIGIAAGSAAIGEALDIETTGVWELPKVSALAIDLGDIVYWDEGAELVTTDDDEGANPKLGVAVADAANPSGSVRVRLSGF